MYTSEIDLSTETTIGKQFLLFIALNNTFYNYILSYIELLELANAYSENQLIKRCIRIIGKGITVQNVAFLYHTSIQYNTKVNNISYYFFLVFTQSTIKIYEKLCISRN